MAHAFKPTQKGHTFFPKCQPLLFITNIPFVIPCYGEQSTTSAGMQLKLLTGGNLAIGGYWNEGLNRTFDSTQNSPYTLNKTLFCLSHPFYFHLSKQPFSETSQKLRHYKKSSHVQKIVTSSSHVFIPYLVLLANITPTQVGLVKTLSEAHSTMPLARYTQGGPGMNMPPPGEF